MAGRPGGCGRVRRGRVLPGAVAVAPLRGEGGAGRSHQLPLRRRTPAAGRASWARPPCRWPRTGPGSPPEARMPWTRRCWCATGRTTGPTGTRCWCPSRPSRGRPSSSTGAGCECGDRRDAPRPAAPAQPVTLTGWAPPGRGVAGPRPADRTAREHQPRRGGPPGGPAPGGRVRRPAGGDGWPTARHPTARPRSSAPDTGLGPHQAYAFQWWAAMVLGFVLVFFGVRREHLDGARRGRPSPDRPRAQEGPDLGRGRRLSPHGSPPQSSRPPARFLTSLSWIECAEKTCHTIPIAILLLECLARVSNMSGRKRGRRNKNLKSTRPRATGGPAVVVRVMVGASRRQRKQKVQCGTE